MTADEGDSPLDDSIFETEAEASVGRREKVGRFVDEFVRAPVKIILSDKRGLAGSAILLAFLFVGTVGVWLVDYPETNEGPRLQSPMALDVAHPLGTDGLGRDMLALVVHGTPQMLEMVIAGALFTTVVATVVGTFAGYKTGRIDTVLMSIADVMMTIPGLPLYMVIAVILEPQEPWIVGIMLSINAWAALARSIRSEVLSLRNASYVEASRVMGVSSPSIIARDVLPNIMPYVTVQFVISSRRIIFDAVALYFLAILPFQGTNWGVIMNHAYYTGAVLWDVSAVHWIVVPMVTIIVFVLGLVLFAQSLDQVFNPRIRVKHARKLEAVQDEEEV